MRAGRIGRGGAAAAMAAARPQSGLQRFVEAVSEVFAPRDTVSFSAVDGVFHPELDSEDGGQRTPPARRVDGPRDVPAHRAYDARAQTRYHLIAARGTRLDVVA